MTHSTALLAHCKGSEGVLFGGTTRPACPQGRRWRPGQVSG